MIAAIVLLALTAGEQAASSTRQPARQAHATEVSAATFDGVAAEARKAWNEKRDNEAMSLFRKGLALRPDWDEGLWYLGTLHYDQENYLEARDSLRRYLAWHPEKGAGWALVGMSDYKLREYEHAREDLRRALAEGLQNNEELAGPVNYYSALLLTREEHFLDSAALLYLLRRGEGGKMRVNVPLDIPMGLNALGYAMLPEEVPADRVELVTQTGVAVFARFEERRDEAKGILENLLRRYPDEQGLHFQYGIVLLAERVEAGVGEMQTVIQLAPSNAGPHLSLAEYYRDIGLNKDALAHVDRALELDSTLVSAYLLKGQILQASGDNSAAIEQFERARKMVPTDTRILWDLMRAYHKAGREQDAAQMTKELERLGRGRGGGK
jgi:tetratricopeptide (TPR) repeat protein